MSAFLKMKQNREANNKKLVEQLSDAQSGGGKYKEDTRFYYPQRDKEGNASVQIRFLPAKDEGAPAFVKEFSHSWQGPGGKWYIENCPTTIDENCPCCEENGRLWNSGLESDKEIVRKRSRSTSFVSNVLIIKDSRNPELEGKVMLFRYGKKIFDKVVGAVKPKFEDDKPIHAFDFWEGATFNLRIVKKDGQTNYDDSKFLEQSVLGSDEYCEAVYNQLHDISEFNAPSIYKSYDELNKRLAIALGTQASGSAGPTAKAADPAPQQSYIQRERAADPAPVTSSAPSAGQTSNAEIDPVSYFEDLANGKIS